MTKKVSKKLQSGQSLMEVTIGLAVGVLLIGAAVLALSAALRSNSGNQKYQNSTALNQDMFEKVRSVAAANWNEIYSKTKGVNTQYYVNIVGPNFSVLQGSSTVVIEGTSFSSFFSVQNVCGDDSGVVTGVTDNNGADKTCVGTSQNDAEDPSTQKVTVYTRWPTGSTNGEVKIVEYPTRWQNSAFLQTDWAGGGGQTGPLTSPNNQFTSSSGIHFNKSGSIQLEGY